jgi:hypothetical protein
VEGQRHGRELRLVHVAELGRRRHHRDANRFFRRL